VSQIIALSREVPHISTEGCSPLQHFGRSGWPKIVHWLVSVNWMQRTLAGFPADIPGIGEDIDGAIQHAPHPGRHSSAGRTAGLASEGMLPDAADSCSNILFIMRTCLASFLLMGMVNRNTYYAINLCIVAMIAGAL
jgi:hypothetical protein